jgi:hypothetical protein
VLDRAKRLGIMSERLLLLSCAGVLLLLPQLVAAHSWYPKRCCHDMDCFLADNVHRLADGTLELSKGSIRVRVTRTFPIEPSPDGKPHFCVWDSGFGLEARCVFLPVDS